METSGDLPGLAESVVHGKAECGLFLLVNPNPARENDGEEEDNKVHVLMGKLL